MIVTVTCNPAIDVTYFVDSLTPGAVHRVGRVEERPGGKGVNVARVLHQLGESVVATGLADHDFGPRVEQTGLAAAFVPALPFVRRTVVVHADDTTTGLWEPGAEPDDPRGAATRLEERVEALLVGAKALVVSGSLPAGVEPGLPAALAKVARARSLPVVLDLDDAPLRVAAEGAGAVMVPNLEELGRLVGGDCGAELDVVAAARAVSRRSGAAVVVTLGVDGMVMVGDEGSWHAAPPEEVKGNPTGAGDSAVAAIVRGLVHEEPWPEILAEAVAVSAAAVVSPVAGEVDVARYETWRAAVPVTAVESFVPGGGA